MSSDDEFRLVGVDREHDRAPGELVKRWEAELRQAADRLYAEWVAKFWGSAHDREHFDEKAHDE